MRKNDYLLISFLLIVALVGYFIHSMGNSSNNKILLIQQDNKIIQRINLYSLKVATKLILPTVHGELILHYDKEGAWVESSPCPDKICIHQGKINKPGQTIACLPEKILLSLVSTEKEAEHDAIIR